MKHRSAITVIIGAALVVFAGFVTWRERSSRARIQLQLANHVNAVAYAVWQLNPRSIEDYLKLAVESGGYQQLAITEPQGVLFSRHTGPPLTGLDAALQRLGLITEVKFQLPINYHDAPIGRMELVWRSKTIYSEIYFLLGLALLVFLIERHLRVVEGRSVLEARVTERTRQLAQVAAALSASEERLLLAVNGGNVGIWEWDIATDALTGNDQLKRIFSLPVETTGLNLQRFFQAIHPEDAVRAEAAFRRALTERSVFEAEYRILRPDHTVRWINARGQGHYEDSGKPVSMAGVALDITERKLAEEQIQRSGERLRLLSRRLIEIQETERRHLARELHDEIGQTLTAAKLHLQNLQAAHNPAAEHKRLADAIKLVDGLLQTVRSLSLNLRPPMLDDLGLVAALRWLLDQHGRTTGQTVRFEHDVFDARLDPVIETTCFRIAQEAMTNVTRHAGADCVDLRLRREDGSLVCSVCDNGRGFDTEAALGRAARGGSLGLVSMEERVSLTGGQIALTSVIGKGTELTARFPLSGEGLNLTRTAS